MGERVRVHVSLDREVRGKALDKARKMGLTFSGFVNDAALGILLNACNNINATNVMILTNVVVIYKIRSLDVRSVNS